MLRKGNASPRPTGAAAAATGRPLLGAAKAARTSRRVGAKGSPSPSSSGLVDLSAILHACALQQELRNEERRKSKDAREGSRRRQQKRPRRRDRSNSNSDATAEDWDSQQDSATTSCSSNSSRNSGYATSASSCAPCEDADLQRVARGADVVARHLIESMFESSSSCSSAASSTTAPAPAPLGHSPQCGSHEQRSSHAGDAASSVASSRHKLRVSAASHPAERGGARGSAALGSTTSSRAHSRQQRLRAAEAAMNAASMSTAATRITLDADSTTSSEECSDGGPGGARGGLRNVTLTFSITAPFSAGARCRVSDAPAPDGPTSAVIRHHGALTRLQQRRRGGGRANLLRSVHGMDASGQPQLVPPPGPHHPPPLTVVLDLDETLVLARHGPICVRPGVAELVAACRAVHAEIIVWTAGITAYVGNILRGISIALEQSAREKDATSDSIPAALEDGGHGARESWFDHLITRNDLWYDESGANVKDLRMLGGRPLDRILVVENNPLSVLSQPRHAVLVQDYIADDTVDDLSLFIVAQIIRDVGAAMAAASTSASVSASTPAADDGDANWVTIAVPDILSHHNALVPILFELPARVCPGGKARRVTCLGLRYQAGENRAATICGAAATQRDAGDEPVSRAAAIHQHHRGGAVASGKRHRPQPRLYAGEPPVADAERPPHGVAVLAPQPPPPHRVSVASGGRTRRGVARAAAAPGQSNASGARALRRGGVPVIRNRVRRRR